MIDKPAWRDVLRREQRRYPEMHAQDAYKLAYQVLNGPEHALNDLDEAREHLFSEMADLGAPATPMEEQLAEAISPRGWPITVLRIHLRSFRALALDPEKLLTALVETSLLLPIRDLEPLAQVWPALMPLLVEDLKLPGDEVEALAREVELGRYPPVHHSAPYRKAYAPRYRVCARRAFRRQFGEDLEL